MYSDRKQISGFMQTVLGEAGSLRPKETWGMRDKFSIFIMASVSLIDTYVKISNITF